MGQGRGHDSRGYGEVTNAQFTAGPKTALTEAQTRAMNDLPARAREIARGHDAAALTRAGMLMANSRYLAQYNYGARWNLAQLAGAYRLQGYDENNAARAAIADYEGAIKVQLGNQTSQTSQYDADVRSGAAGAQPPAPVGSPTDITINVPTGQPTTGPPPPIFVGGKPGAAPPGGQLPPLPVRPPKLNANTVFQQAQAHLKDHSSTPDQVRQTLSSLAADGQLTQAEANQISHMLLLDVPTLP